MLERVVRHPGAGGICAVNRVRKPPGQAWMLLLKFRKVFYHITGIVHIERPAAYAAVSKIYYEIHQERSVFFEFHG